MKRAIGIAMLFWCFSTWAVLDAEAIDLPFIDEANYWPGWQNGTGDDSLDSVGIPQFSGGTLSVANGLLTSITVNQTASSSYWNVISPGDLFLDVNGDLTWDYYVNLTSWTLPGVSNPDPAAGSYDLYSINQQLNSSSGYILTGNDNQGGWSGYLIRNNHPVGYSGTNGAYVGDVAFSGWNGASSLYSFDFTGLDDGGVPVDNSFIIGWTVNCANDVLYVPGTWEDGGGQDIVPEPATLAMLGSGLLGLGWFGRRKVGRKGN